MFVRLFVLVVCLTALSGSKAEVTVKNSSYHDLVISFSPTVAAENGKLAVDSLKNLLEDTSQVLRTAIGLRISGVTFHLPSTWDTSSWEGVSVEPTSVLSEGEEDILVDDIVDSAFGKQPFALQYGGCGVPARRITVPVDFLNGTDGYPKGKLLAREWLKYRYGVFDENGFDGDDMYPPYYNIPGTTDAKITDCTHPEVEYYFKDTDGNNCSLDIPFASTAKWEIHPKEDIALNVMSSLMYFHHELPNMEKVCGKDHPHKDSTPSKQNILCSGSSIWNILEMSRDFNGTTADELQDDDDEGIKFSYTQESKPRVVVAFEYSDSLHEQRHLVLFAIRRFMHALPDGSDFGLYSFNEQPTEIRPLSSLTARDVTIPSNFDWNRAVCTTCAMEKAVEALADKPQIRSSIILIVGSNSSGIGEGLVEKFNALNVCLKIIAFTSEGNKAVGYEELISSSSCNSIVQLPKEVEDEIQFKTLYLNLQEAVSQSPSNIKISTINVGTMSHTKSIGISMNRNAEKYTLWMAISSELSGVDCTAGSNIVTLNISVQSNNIASYTFDPVEEDVTCKLSFPKSPEVFTQVEMTSKPGEYIEGEVWIHDPSESDVQMPVTIYARINFGSYPIQDAKVTAIVFGLDGNVTTLDLFDNGRGNPDITKHDGIYSRYFVDFTIEGEHRVIVTASDDAGKAQVGSKGEDQCCGSKVKSTQEQAPFFINTFSSSFTAKKKPDGGFKPSRILDLRVARFDPVNSVVLKWTAPGGEADKGNAKTYILKSFSSREDILQNFDKGLPLNVTINPQAYGSEEEFEVRLDNFERNTAYYLSMRSVNELGKESDTSNVLEFFVPEDTDATKIDETTTDPSSLEDNKQSGVDKKTIGIIIGVLALVIILIIVAYLFVYFFVRKPRQKEAARKASSGSNRNTTTPPVSLNSIPADVILKHHNEVVSAKSQHKDPPIFKEENLETIDSASESPRDGDRKDSSQRNNVEYSQIQKRQPEHESTHQTPPKSPKRMTNV